MTDHHATNPSRRPTRRRAFAVAGLAAAAGLLAACGGGSGTSASPTTANAAQPAGNASTIVTGSDSAVLPVNSNPITNTATTATLQIAQVLVENNVDPATGKVTSDHLEIQLANSGGTDLGDVEIYYTYRDPASGASESYYAKLPADFAIPKGGSRTIHFDGVSGPDHLPVNKFSLYYTDTNALEVTVTASANGAAIQTKTVNKDAGGAETVD